MLGLEEVVGFVSLLLIFNPPEAEMQCFGARVLHKF